MELRTRTLRRLLRRFDCGTSTAPVNPPTPALVAIAWDKVLQAGRTAYRITSASGLTAGHRYLLTLEAVGG